MAKERVDILIVTAADGEDSAVRDVTEGAIGAWRQIDIDSRPEYLVWRCDFVTPSGRPLRIALARALRMGVEATQHAVSELGRDLEPECLAMCGVCAGRPGWTELGDVIIADRVYRYDVGEQINETTGGDPELRSDMLTHPLRPDWLQRANAFRMSGDAPWLTARPIPRARQEGWALRELHAGRDPRESPDRSSACPDWSEVAKSLHEGGLVDVGGDVATLTAAGRTRVRELLWKELDPPAKENGPNSLRIHVGPLGTGSNLVRDVDIWERLGRNQRSLRGFDMEASVIGFAAWAAECRWIVAKGVMDFGEPSRGQGFRQFAARASAEVLIAFVRENLSPAAPQIQEKPFARVDEHFELFRSPWQEPREKVLPSYAEYIRGKVPPLAADAEVMRRLNEYGWTCVVDVASVGKTTLALRIATDPDYRSRPAFYIDFAHLLEESESAVVPALGRIARSDVLLILDNVHHNPRLAKKCWEEWNDRLRGSRLLLIGTRRDRPEIRYDIADPMDLLALDALNPAVELAPTPEDLWAIVRHLYERVGRAGVEPLQTPPLKALVAWHRDYGTALAAFCVAALERLQGFQRADWSCPPTVARVWVRKNWLGSLAPEVLENLLCLSVFGAQDLELGVQKEALPQSEHAEDVNGVSAARGASAWQKLVVSRRSGSTRQYHWFSLREPGWGRLILAAQREPIGETRLQFETRLLFAAGARHVSAAAQLLRRFELDARTERRDAFVAHLAEDPSGVLESIPGALLMWFLELCKAANATGHSALAALMWEALAAAPDDFARRARRSYLWQVRDLLRDARVALGERSEIFWSALANDAEGFAAHILETRPDQIGQFIAAAEENGHDVGWLWSILERERDRLADAVLETVYPQRAAGRSSRLGDLIVFLELAAKMRKGSVFWRALEQRLEQFGRCLLEASPKDVKAFFVWAARYGHDTSCVWHAFDGKPESFGECVETAPAHAAVFLQRVRRAGHDADPLWQVLECDAERLGKGLFNCRDKDEISRFFEVAKSEGRTLDSFWSVVERAPERLVEIAMTVPFQRTVKLLERAHAAQRDVGPLWRALEASRVEVARRALRSSLPNVVAFVELGRAQGHDMRLLWSAISEAAEEFARNLPRTKLSVLTAFLEKCEAGGHDVGPLWRALTEHPERLADCAVQAEAADVAAFLDAARRHGHASVRIWNGFENRAEAFAKWATRVPSEYVMNFLAGARKEGTDTAPLWRALEDEAELFAARLRRGRSSVAVSLLSMARDEGRMLDACWTAIERDAPRLADFLLRTPHDVPAYFALARAAGRDTRPVGAVFDQRLRELASDLASARLGFVVTVLGAARAAGEDVAPHVGAWRDDPRAFAEAALRALPLDLTRFLKVVRDEGGRSEPFCNALESDPARLEAWVARASPGDCAGLLPLVREADRPKSLLWKLLYARKTKPPSRVVEAPSRARLSCRELAELCKTADDAVLKPLFAGLSVSSWEKVSREQPLWGLLLIAERCAAADRPELEVPLAQLAMRRANRRDFPASYDAFVKQIVWLAAHAPPDADRLFPPFLDAICDEAWQRKHLSMAPYRALATGLRLSALRLPAAIRERIVHRRLGDRLEEATGKYPAATSGDKVLIVRLLGSAALCGFHAPARWVEPISLLELSLLPEVIYPIPKEDTRLNPMQIELWLGLHEIEQSTRVRLSLRGGVLRKVHNHLRRTLVEAERFAPAAEIEAYRALAAWLDARAGGEERGAAETGVAPDLDASLSQTRVLLAQYQEYAPMRGKLMREGEDVAVTVERLRSVDPGFDVKRFGFARFTEYLRYACAGTRLCVARTRDGNCALKFRGGVHPPDEVLPDLGPPELHPTDPTP